MDNPDGANLRFNTRTGQLIRRCLRACRYRDDLIEDDYGIGDRSIPVVTFAHYPRDARSSCMAFLPETAAPAADIAALRELGVPVVFFVGSHGWEMWSVRSDGARRVERFDSDSAERFFETRKADFAPGAVFRAKTWARAEGARQLDFVDTGLLPMVESEAGQRLRQLFEDMLGHSLDALDLDPAKMTAADSHWLVRANFWLLAGKLMRDKTVPKFTRLNLHDVQDVFDRVAEHYDAPRINANGRLKALRGAASLAANFASLRCISTETLGALYEESMLSPQVRKLLSVHRTPTYLVDYMLARMSGWMENEIGIENCRVWEPSCGHAPFLVGAVRLLSDLLPERIASDRNERRKFLRSHIGGCDRDAFALEIARLSLTLADIPNPNGWKLESVPDMFEGDYLAEKIGANSLVCVNPPFENADVSAEQRANGDLRFHRNGQAAEMLRRVVRFSKPGTAFGIVVPQTILEGGWFTELRRELMTQCDIKEVTVFPDKVFQFADVETGIILARKRPEGKPAASHYTFRRVREKGIEAFINGYQADQNSSPSAKERLESDEVRLLVPRLAELWTINPHAPRFSSIAEIGNGFIFLSPEHPDFPKGEVTISPCKAESFVEGFALVSGSPDTHLLPHKAWLNQKPKILQSTRAGTQRGRPQILLNHVRASRMAWRLKAFIDQVGRPATDAFLLLRPLSLVCSIEALWGLANSPFTNAYTFAHSAKKHIASGFLGEMPIPKLDDHDLRPLEAAVSAYLTAARAFSATEKPATKNKSPRKKATAKNTEAPELPLDGIAAPETADTAREHLRALHWRVDAEVLKLYAMPAELERELLDFFDGVPRVGVPFEQRGYIPLTFRETMRLDEYLRITDEWEQTDERRCQLIEQRKKGGRTKAQEQEFAELQRLFDLRRKYIRWQETGDANAPLADLKMLRRLLDEDARSNAKR